MADAASSFLNQSLRSERQARLAREQAEQERRRRLEHHGSAFCRRILAGAFERIYQADGSYRLRDIHTGAWLEDLPATDVRSEQDPTPSALPLASTLPPAIKSPDGQTRSPADSPRHTQRVVAARQIGYVTALRDVARWISAAATKPRMDAVTLAALNDQIARLSSRAQTATTVSGAREGP